MTTTATVHAADTARVRDWLRAGRDNPHAHQATVQQRAGFAGAIRRLRARRREGGGACQS